MCLDENCSLSYIDDLDRKNYRNYIEDMRKNLNIIIRMNNLTIEKASNKSESALSNVSNLIGVVRLTLKRFIVDGNDSISFITANKFNNFIYRIHKLSSDENCINKTSLDNTSL